MELTPTSESRGRAVHEVHVFPSSAGASHAGAASFVEQALQATAERGRFIVALSGGDTPRAMYELLAQEPFTSMVPWERVHLFWGDDRAVPPDHARSNYRMAREAFIGRVPIPDANVHRIHGELPAEEAARRCQQELERIFGDVHVPVFDLVHLGIGPDGHTASLFPHTAALTETEAWVTTNIDRSHGNEPRVTLTFPVINAARRVEVLLLEPQKAELVRKVLAGEGSVEELPARGIAPRGPVIWLLTEGAARRIRPRGGR